MILFELELFIFVSLNLHEHFLQNFLFNLNKIEIKNSWKLFVFKFLKFHIPKIEMDHKNESLMEQNCNLNLTNAILSPSTKISRPEDGFPASH